MTGEWGTDGVFRGRVSPPRGTLADGRVVCPACATIQPGCWVCQDGYVEEEVVAEGGWITPVPPPWWAGELSAYGTLSADEVPGLEAAEGPKRPRLG